MEDRDTIRLGQYRKTTMDRRNLSPAWLYIERRGETLWMTIAHRPEGDILEVRNFLAECAMEGALLEDNRDWGISWDELDCEPYIYGGDDGGFLTPLVMIRCDQSWKAFLLGLPS